jgi:hypothetical protein
MGQLKKYYDDYLSSEDFDLMFDDEYELWLNNKNKNKNQQLWEEEKVLQTDLNPQNH